MQPYCTKRLLLAPLKLEDNRFIFELVNSEGWIKYIGDRAVTSEEHAKAYIQKIIDDPNINYWVVRLLSDNTSIGIVTLIKKEYLEFHDIGFAFLPKFADQGFAFEATQKVLLSIGNAGHSKILATILPGNTRSIKLLEKLGFRFHEEIEVNGEKLLVYEIVMQKNILWTGIYYHSIENCVVRTTGTGAEIRSCIIGNLGDTIYKADYLITINQNWETTYVEIKSQLNSITQSFILQQATPGTWTIDGHPSDQFHRCIDIDISLTPFTNSLPINRLKMNVHEEREINVLYIDILGHEIKQVKQKYTRISELEYKFENIPNDFEAIIQVDQCGLVVSYPGLFERTAMK